ncbi:hypothetical protein, partial [Pseudomonas sp. HY7a-MNA-CIBAN-0227]|uniref:hypothetical protein n=1 Tax=Pseudomonas sp. HY7a-MNA-CIBAN-0227 TaxID=3140474 RepID=UPI003329A9C6
MRDGFATRGEADAAAGAGGGFVFAAGISVSVTLSVLSHHPALACLGLSVADVLWCDACWLGAA